jgi:hypothetical protein
MLITEECHTILIITKRRACRAAALNRKHTPRGVKRLLPHPADPALKSAPLPRFLLPITVSLGGGHVRVLKTQPLVSCHLHPIQHSLFLSLSRALSRLLSLARRCLSLSFSCLLVQYIEDGDAKKRETSRVRGAGKKRGGGGELATSEARRDCPASSLRPHTLVP